MTSITFLCEGKRITGFDAVGHSGFAAEGEDIVCAAITSALRLVECVVNEVLGLCAAVKVNGSLFKGVVNGKILTPEEEAERIKSVTEKDVVNCCRHITPDTVYFMYGRGVQEDEDE